jgi:pimeloyl-ACP methyl ester carboxylesterase
MPYATNDGVRIRYEIDGSGPPLLLHIGGFGGALEDWYDAGYVAALRDDYQLVLLDPRGQGRSDAPHDPAAYMPGQREGDVLTVLDAAGIARAHFWGYSLGGSVGFAVGAHAPERVISLILGGAHPYAINRPPVEEDPFMQTLLHEGMAGWVAQWEAHDPGFWASEGERSRWLATDVEAIIAARRAGTGYPGVGDALPNIRVPTLIYCGTDDQPELPARAAREMPNARFVALEGLDHAAAINQSAVILPHVRTFLSEVQQLPRTG